MKPATFLLRVYATRRTDSSPPDEPIPQTWEVRAEADGGLGMRGQKISVFYEENDSLNLPPVDSYIEVAIGSHPTEFVAKPQTPDEAPPPNSSASKEQD